MTVLFEAFILTTSTGLGLQLVYGITDCIILVGILQWSSITNSRNSHFKKKIVLDDGSKSFP